MSNTYTQLLIQLVFAVQGRDSLIHEPIREKVEKYITGCIQNNGHKLLAIYCMPDHIHIFVGLNPKQAISELARDVKTNSSKWINQQKLVRGRFSWQEGFGAFSYAKSQKGAVINYVRNQPRHHQKRVFKEEYLELLTKFEIPHDHRYLFKWVE